MSWILTCSFSIIWALTGTTASLSSGPQLNFDDLCGKCLKLPLQTPQCSRQGCKVLVASERFKVKSAIIKFNKASEKIMLCSPVAGLHVHCLKNCKRLFMVLSIHYLIWKRCSRPLNIPWAILGGTCSVKLYVTWDRVLSKLRETVAAVVLFLRLENGIESSFLVQLTNTCAHLLELCMLNRPGIAIALQNMKSGWQMVI